MPRAILTKKELEQKFVKVFFGTNHAVALDSQTQYNRHATMRFFVYDEGYYLEGWNSSVSSRFVVGMKTSIVKAVNFLQKYCDEETLTVGLGAGYKYKAPEMLPDGVAAQP